MIMSVLRFSDYLNGYYDAKPERRMYFREVSARKIRIIVDTKEFRIPYLVNKFCRSVVSYAGQWLAMHGDDEDLCDGFESNHMFMCAMQICFKKYKYVRWSDVIPAEFGISFHRRAEIAERADFYYELLQNACVRVYVDDEEYVAPIIVRGFVEDFNRYWVRWIDQRGPNYNLKENGVGSADLLEKILQCCFMEYAKLISRRDVYDMRGMPPYRKKRGFLMVL